MKNNFRIMITKQLLSLLVFIAFLDVSQAQGYISQTIQHDGLTREYSIYIPASYDGTTNFPLLFNFHGGVMMLLLIGRQQPILGLLPILLILFLYTPKHVLIQVMEIL